MTFYLDRMDDDLHILSFSQKDQEWNLINSLYYCSSLYTTVGKQMPLKCNRLQFCKDMFDNYILVSDKDAKKCVMLNY